jgi:hypothetical protein
VLDGFVSETIQPNGVGIRVSRAGSGSCHRSSNLEIFAFKIIDIRRVSPAICFLLCLSVENALAYRQLMRSVASAPEVREMVDNIRDATSDQILAGLFGDQVPAKAHAAVRGWLWYRTAEAQAPAGKRR